VIDDLSSAERETLGALRASRGACPPADALVEYDSLSAADRERHAHHAHIVTCSRCQLALLHMHEPAQSSSMLRWALPIAAVVVLGIAITVVDRSGGTLVPPAETVRGTEIQITAPAGAVEMIREFAWQSPIRAERYRVVVRRGATVVWQTETTSLSAAPPPAGIIQRDVQYEWQVEAIDREGTVRMTSPPQPFVVY
jgi:4-amino-4-deoxy-L-arabinose transferase-like glycosyltransferase